MSKLIEHTIAQFLTNKKVRTLILPYLHDWMFTDPILKIIIKALSTGKYNDTLNPKTFILDLHTNFKASPKECEEAYEILKSGSAQTLDREDEVIQAIQEFIRSRWVAHGVERLATAETPKAKALGYDAVKNAVNLVITRDEFYDFSDINHVTTAKDADFPPGGVIIKSKFSLINNCSSYGGYKYGDLIMYCGAPGIGKTTSMLNEGANTIDQGFKVAHLFLGDMSEFDGYVKYLSYWSRTSTEDIIQNGFESVLTPQISEKFSRLRIKAYPSETYTVYDLISKIESLYGAFKFDMLIVDYDSNIKESSDNMYKEGGTTYGLLKGYSAGKCVTLIGSQTKINYWDIEVLPKDCAAESSRKQHAIDIMIAIGRNKDVRAVGTATLCKMRRGTDGVNVRLFMNYRQSRIDEISPQKYEETKIVYKQRADDATSQEGISLDGLG